MRRLRSHISHNAIGYVALFVALAGTSYAAIRLPRDSVTSRELAHGSVGASELKDNAVTSRKVKGLRLRDFKDGELNSLKARGGGGGTLPGPDGPPGPPGATGPGGGLGPPGVAGIAQLTYAVAAKENPGEYTSGAEIVTVHATCPSGESVTGGSLDLFDPGYQFAFASHPFDGDDEDVVPDDGWEGVVVDFDNPDTPSGDVYNAFVTAICGPTDHVALSG
jgi:hypothetical protein